MTISISGTIDDPQFRVNASRIFFEAFLTVIQGPEGSRMLSEYVGKATEIARELGERSLQILTTESEKDEAAGRLKYISSQLLILRGCAQAAQITNGNFRITGLQFSER